MKRPNVNILYICVIFALITLFSCKGKGGTYRDGVFYPNDEKLAGSKKPGLSTMTAVSLPRNHYMS